MNDKDEREADTINSMTIGSPTTASGSKPGQSSKLEHLPRLRRQEAERMSKEYKKPTMSETLNRMRIEDRRRNRNLEAHRQRSESQTQGSNDFSSSSSPSSSSMRANAPSFRAGIARHPTSSSSSSLPLSASARAGMSYLAATQLSEQDSVEARRKHELRRKFAGPVPPSSWTQNGMDEGERGSYIVNNAIEERKLDRKVALTASRVFFAQYENGRNHESSNIKYGKQKNKKSTLSLTDFALLSIIETLNFPHSKLSSQFEEQVFALPVHLKESALGLAGRYSQSKGLGEVGLQALFGKREGNDVEQCEKAEEEDSFAEEDEDVLDSWESEAQQMDWERVISITMMDLSFASISARSLRSLILSPSIAPNNIRALSLAGWGYGDDVRQPFTGRTTKCLRTSTTLINMLDQMNNLEILSLAATKLLPGVEDYFVIKKNDDEKEGSSEDLCTGLSPEIASEALAFLKKLARRTSHLQTLDLSSCHWINGAVLSNLGIFSTNVPVRRILWPRMQNLILMDCPAFNEKKPPNTESQVKANQGTFSGQWHAAHHGIARFTNSPYFLSHKPGLGRSVLAHGIGAWDSVNVNKQTQSLIGREVEALARHNGHVQQSRQSESLRRGGIQGLENERIRSAFDDESLTDFNLIATQTDGSVPGIFTGFAISHGVAPFSNRRSQNSSSTTSPSWSTAPRCPVSGKRVANHEWERARALDAIHGRWGSAITGTLEEEMIEEKNLFNNFTSGSRGEFITVYF